MVGWKELIRVLRDNQGGRYQVDVSESGWEEIKSSNIGVLTSSESIKQMRVSEEMQAVEADQGVEN